MRFKRHTRDTIGIDLAPLVDVVFLLLIFFMVSTTFTKQGKLSITLPEAEQNIVPQQQAQSIDLTIDREGNYAVDGQALLRKHKTHLVQYLQQYLLTRELQQKNPALIISADANTPHQAVVTAMDAAAELGLANLRISVIQH